SPERLGNCFMPMSSMINRSGLRLRDDHAGLGAIEKEEDRQERLFRGEQEPRRGVQQVIIPWRARGLACVRRGAWYTPVRSCPITCWEAPVQPLALLDLTEPQWFCPLFIAAWLGVTSLGAVLGGWAHLSTHFRAEQAVNGERFSFASGSMRAGSFP